MNSSHGVWQLTYVSQEQFNIFDFWNLHYVGANRELQFD